MKITELFTAIMRTSGSNDKKVLLDQHMNPTIKQIFEDTYGSQKYYVKKYNVKTDSILTIDNDYSVFHNMLQKLASREVTGNDAIALVEDTIGMYRLEEQWLLCRVIDRNLKIGISMENFLSIVGGKEDKFEVALAFNLDKVNKIDPVDGTYFASRKLDGCRTICMVNNYMQGDELIQEVKFFSRSGKEFTTLSNLVEPIKAFTSFLMGKWVIDGECCIMEGENENFQLLMREITRKNYTIENPKYKMFDIITMEEFEGKTAIGDFQTRYNDLLEYYYQSQFAPGVQQRLEVLEQELVTSQEIFDKWVQRVKDNGWEGFMLRKNAPYKRGRTKDLIKVKKFQDDEYIVEEVSTGKVVYNEGGAKEYDVVAALYITHKGNRVKVGSGLSKEQRIEWFKDPSQIIGKTITVQYFEETQSKSGEYSLRFPVLKYVYENGRDC